jgi:hypothetical protein
MNEQCRDLLVAADNWLTAINAITTADEAQCGTEAQQDDFDAAGVALAAAIMTWRNAGRPM